MLHGALAYARSGGYMDHRIIDKLESVSWVDLSKENQIALLRCYSLLLIRQGKPYAEISQRIISNLSPHFPSQDSEIDRTLSQILLFVNSPDVVPKCMAILERESNAATESHPEILLQGFE